jgi:hypothetical protein
VREESFPAGSKVASNPVIWGQNESLKETTQPHYKRGCQHTEE